jgi:hypothetical protein
MNPECSFNLFTRVHHWSLCEPDESSPHPPTKFKIHFNIILPSMSRSSEQSLSFLSSYKKTLHISPFPAMHATCPISIPWFGRPNTTWQGETVYVEHTRNFRKSSECLTHFTRIQICLPYPAHCKSNDCCMLEFYTQCIEYNIQLVPIYTDNHSYFSLAFILYYYMFRPTDGHRQVKHKYNRKVLR